MMRVVFMGTPEFAVPSLEALAAAGYTIAGVITQPDRPVGRGHKLAPPPVKAKALELGLPVYQFERLRAQEGLIVCARSRRTWRSLRPLARSFRKSSWPCPNSAR